jgi:hypothetical protein
MNIAWITVLGVHSYEVWNAKTGRKLKVFDCPERARAWVEGR